MARLAHQLSPTSDFAAPREWGALDRPRVGYLYVLAVPIAAGIATARGVQIAGFNYTGWIWILFLVAGVLLLLAEKAVHQQSRIALPVRIWMPWMALVWLSLVWAKTLEARNIQEAAQITMPLVVGMIASMFVRTPAQLALLLKVFCGSFFLLAASVVVARLGWLGDDVDMSDGLRPMGLSAAVIGCVFLAAIPDRWIGPVLGWGACIVLTVVTGGRLPMIALLVIPGLHPRLRGTAWRVGAVAAVAISALALFYTPMVQERFFYSGHGTLTDLLTGNIRGSGRFDAWPLILDEAYKHPVLGVGVGAAYTFVPIVWPTMHHVHNDYLRIFYELGGVGLAVFLLVMVRQLVDLRRQVRATSGVTQRTFAAALLAMLVFLVAAAAGNPLGYNVWFVNPLFALLGAAYGVRQQSETGAPALAEQGPTR